MFKYFCKNKHFRGKQKMQIDCVELKVLKQVQNDNWNTETTSAHPNVQSRHGAIQQKQRSH